MALRKRSKRRSQPVRFERNTRLRKRVDDSVIEEIRMACPHESAIFKMRNRPIKEALSIIDNLYAPAAYFLVATFNMIANSSDYDEDERTYARNLVILACGLAIRGSTGITPPGRK
jgi:hypothetical protein